MHNQALMCIRDCTANSAEQFKPFGCCQAMLIAVLVDSLTFDIFHYEKWQPIFRRPTVKQPGNIRMIQACEDLTLGTKSTHDAACVHPRLYNFNGHGFAILVIDSNAKINRAHPTVSDL